MIKRMKPFSAVTGFRSFGLVFVFETAAGALNCAAVLSEESPVVSSRESALDSDSSAASVSAGVDEAMLLLGDGKKRP